MSKFSNYHWKQSVTDFINLEGFTEPTSIQQKVFTEACKGKSIIASAATGTGKTHAFLIPIMESIDTSKSQIQAIICTPTRELATQIYNRSKLMCKADKQLNIALISGGIEKSRMREKLKNLPHIVIGTPGRIKDMFLNEKTLPLHQAQILVIDEADMTFEYGFLDDVDAFTSKLKADIQIMLFSATIPKALQPFLKKYMQHPIQIHLNDKKNMPKEIQHILIPCHEKSMSEKLFEILPIIQPYICLIFANTRKEVSDIAKSMRDASYDIIEIHGDLTPRERQKSMKLLMQHKTTYIIASDIASRGIDIEGITHVISLGFPSQIDFYIHRAGRTGRANKTGITYALYKEKDDQAIRTLEKKGIHFEHQRVQNNVLQDIMPLHKKKFQKNDELERDIAKILAKKKQVVKPGYKQKRKKAVQNLKQKAKRAIIQKDIKRQQIEKAKSKSLTKRGIEK